MWYSECARAETCTDPDPWSTFWGFFQNCMTFINLCRLTFFSQINRFHHGSHDVVDFLQLSPANKFVKNKINIFTILIYDGNEMDYSFYLPDLFDCRPRVLYIRIIYASLQRLN